MMSKGHGGDILFLYSLDKVRHEYQVRQKVSDGNLQTAIQAITTCHLVDEINNLIQDHQLQ